MRAQSWLAVLAALAVITLLVAFHRVVSAAVQHGESRRVATAARAEAVWRCNALRGLRAVRDDCLVEARGITNVASAAL